MARLRELDSEIQKLEAQTMQAEASARILYYEELQGIYEKRNAAEMKLEELQHSGEESWQGLKHGLEAAWHDLRDTVKIAVTKLRIH